MRRLFHVRGGYIDSNAAPALMLGCNAVFYPGAVMDEKHGEKKGDRPRLLPDSWGETQ